MKGSTVSASKAAAVSWAVLVVLCFVCKPVSAWGGLFNRYNPAIMGDLGYTGGHGGYANALFSSSSDGGKVRKNTIRKFHGPKK